MIEFLIQQQKKKRNVLIAGNESRIVKLSDDLKIAENDLWKRQIESKIAQLKIDNENMERKNRRREI